jgi:hypothetical protein
MKKLGLMVAMVGFISTATFAQDASKVIKTAPASRVEQAAPASKPVTKTLPGSEASKTEQSAPYVTSKTTPSASSTSNSSTPPASVRKSKLVRKNITEKIEPQPVSGGAKK